MLPKMSFTYRPKRGSTRNRDSTKINITKRISPSPILWEINELGKKLSGIDTRYFKHKWVSRLQISRKNRAKPTPTKPSKKYEHIRAPSKQLRDQS